jgi:hypothetical protein
LVWSGLGLENSMWLSEGALRFLTNKH